MDLIRQRATEAGLGIPAYVRMVFGHNADRTVDRWRAGTPVTTATADRYACRLGLHPANVWTDWYERA